MWTRFEPGIVDPFDGRMFVEEASDVERARVLLPDAEMEYSSPAQTDKVPIRGLGSMRATSTYSYPSNLVYRAIVRQTDTRSNP